MGNYGSESYKRYRASEKHKATSRGYALSWRHANPERNIQNKKSWDERNPFYYRCQRRGITVNQLLTMYADQEGLCLICDRKFPLKMLVVDHDHSSNKVRGLLCNKCNSGIGLFGENLNFLNGALKYVSSFQERA